MSKNSTKGSAKLHINNGYLAGAPRFFPAGADGHIKHCLVFNVIVNQGKDEKTGREFSVTMPMKIWGEWADKMAKMLDVGTSVNIIATPTSYTRETGRVINGQMEKTTDVYFTVDECHIIKESGKKAAANLAANVATMINAGVILPQYAGVLTMDNLMKHPATDMSPFNELKSRMSGLNGNAHVWTKNDGDWTKRVGQAPVAQTVPGGGALDLNQLQAALAALGMEIAPKKVETTLAIPEVVATDAAEMAESVNAFDGVAQ